MLNLKLQFALRIFCYYINIAVQICAHLFPYNYASFMHTETNDTAGDVLCLSSSTEFVIVSNLWGVWCEV